MQTAVQENQPSSFDAPSGGRLRQGGRGIGVRGPSRSRTVTALRVLVACATLQACQSVPPELLASYTDAFTEARFAGEALYNDYGRRILPATRAPARAAGSGAGASPIPQFEVPRASELMQSAEAAMTDEKRDELTVPTRLAAFRALDEYNQALTALATGQSVEVVRQGVGRLSGALSEVSRSLSSLTLDGIVPYASAFKQVAELLLRATDQEKLRTALLEEVERPVGIERLCAGEPAAAAAGSESSAVPTQAHPALVLIDLLEADALCVYRTTRTVYQAEYVNAAERMDEADGTTEMATAIADARKSVAEAKAYAETIRSYRALLGRARSGFVTVLAYAAQDVASLPTEQKIALAAQLNATLRGTGAELIAGAVSVRASLPR